jgi:hypothetical protein
MKKLLLLSNISNGDGINNTRVTEGLQVDEALLSNLQQTESRQKNAKEFTISDEAKAGKFGALIGCH